ncbi:flagella basal body P-ring formation protein FlgA [Chromobacterium sphagni]|uniref:Flagella basal body P-ring formation protein FlgA n=1 Tax=Chromobacterium sphagni TaxID=1903179 RepID=A0A1S1WXS4_9NEIS|nr:flagellar basal body P-ring formation chaperone FlgA [Chromobacterium sphagni]OHX12072.1 flagella basal body P-ring formation protein FlgA [Chromobacterium sphagni]
MSRLIASLLALPLLAGAGQGRAAESVQAKADVVVDAREARLSDIVVGRWPGASDPALASRVVASGLRIGEPRELSRRQVLMAWQSALGAAAGQWPLDMPERITVTRSGGAPAAGRIEQAARQALEQRLSGACRRAELRPRAEQADAMLPGQGLRLAARVPPSPQLARRMVVWLDAFEGEALYRSWPVWFDVACYRPVLRARREIAKGESLSPDNVEEAVADVAATGRALQSLQGLMAGRALPAGGVLQESDALPLPLVRKGAHVAARVRSGAVELELSAIAVSDGAAGEVVYAKSEKGGAAFKARVAADGAVDVM